MKIHSYHKTPTGTELPLMDIHGQPYLKVPHRVVWFRELHPEGRIQTQAVTIGPDSALFLATIYNGDGQVLATAHKFENKQGFGDFIEKAETGSIGRALGLCGFGTQFTGDEFEEGERLADSPTERVAGKPSQTRSSQSEQTTTKPTNMPAKATNGARNSRDPGDYVITFGKHKGKVVREHVSELVGYKSYLLNTARTEGKAVGGAAAEFIENLDRFMEASVEDEMMSRGEQIPF